MSGKWARANGCVARVAGVSVRRRARAWVRRRYGLEAGVRQAISKWRDSLVNLTGTNRLLNLKPSRTGMLVIARPNPSEVLTRVRDGNGYGFRALKADPAPDAEDTDAPAESEVGPQFPPAPNQLALRSLATRTGQSPTISRCLTSPSRRRRYTGTFSTTRTFGGHIDGHGPDPTGLARLAIFNFGGYRG
jgi:hypothetical protein